MYVRHTLFVNNFLIILTVIYRDCKDAYSKGQHTNGVYHVQTDSLPMSIVTLQQLVEDGLSFKEGKMDRWTFTEDGTTMRMDLVI